MAVPETKLHQDVDTIRDILFGTHLQEILGRIDALEKEVARLEKENNQLRKALKTEETSRKEADLQRDKVLDEAQNDFLVQLQNLDKKSEAQSGSYQKALQNTIQETQTKVSQQLEKVQSDLNAELESHQLHQDQLIAMLANALSAYTNDTKTK